MKIHLGCGAVYLDGWLNVDLPATGTYLAADRPDLVDKLKTTDADYYARHKDKTQDLLRHGPLQQEWVCDTYGSWESIPSAYWEVDEILARHSFEHLSITEAHRALDQADAVLKDGGILRLDVPDHEATLRLYRETGDEFYMRHLLGPRRDDHGFHMMSYTRDRLRRLVEDHPFAFVEEEPNIHFYPAFCLKFIKRGLKTACDYAPAPYAIPDHWICADLGPGSFPWPRANYYIDYDPEVLAQCPAGKETILSDIGKGLPGVKRHAFDYIRCSHVMEHVDNPRIAAEALSRVAHRGTVVLPSVIKESMFNFEEATHQWLILPSSNGGGPIFVKHNPQYMAKIKDVDVQKITSRLFRTGPTRIHPEQRHLRNWYFKNEQHLDVVIHWEGEFKVQVVE